jgi:hypothetical protein
VTSDFGVEEANHDKLAGRSAILSDICSEFSSAFGVCLIIALGAPGLLLGVVFFEWTSQPAYLLFVAATLFVVFITISLYALVWFRWAERREAEIYELMLARGEEERGNRPSIGERAD